MEDFEDDEGVPVENRKQTKLAGNAGSIFEMQKKTINQGSQEDLSMNKSRKSSKATFHNVTTPGAKRKMQTKRLNQLMTSIWPQDPLKENKKLKKAYASSAAPNARIKVHQLSDKTELEAPVENDSSDEMIHGDSSTTEAVDFSKIRRQFNQIKKTETKLSNKISTYVKKKGGGKFIKS